MRIVVLGATGGVGRHLLEQAVGAGHQVTAVVRRPDRLGRQVPHLRADLADADDTGLQAALESVVAGTDAVLSALGPRSAREAGIVTRGTRLVVAAMRATGARRLIVVSAVPVPTVPSPDRPHPPRSDPDDGPFLRAVLNPIVRRAFRATYLDLATMEDVVRASGLDWTIVRPPRLVDRPATGRYRTSSEQNLRGGRSVSRADVAQFMLQAATRPATVGQAVRIAD
jgi:putative NADH-flavin reductase